MFSRYNEGSEPKYSKSHRQFPPLGKIPHFGFRGQSGSMAIAVSKRLSRSSWATSIRPGLGPHPPQCLTGDAYLTLRLRLLGLSSMITPKAPDPHLRTAGRSRIGHSQAASQNQDAGLDTVEANERLGQERLPRFTLLRNSEGAG
jgi:hypothetical protein